MSSGIRAERIMNGLRDGVAERARVQAILLAVGERGQAFPGRQMLEARRTRRLGHSPDPVSAAQPDQEEREVGEAVPEPGRGIARIETSGH